MNQDFWDDQDYTGTGAITEFCRQANVALKAKNPKVVLSAALMGETNAQSYYGQDPGQRPGRVLHTHPSFILLLSYHADITNAINNS